MRKRDFLKASAASGLATAPLLANAQAGPT